MLDFSIFIGFMVLTLLLGISASVGVQSMRQFAIGNQNFSNRVIVATLVATWIGGGTMSFFTTQIYNQGLFFLISSLGVALVFFIFAHFFAARMGEFLGDLSIAQSMKKLYGRKAQIITAILGLLRCMFIVAIQLKVCGNIIGMFFDVSNFHTTLAATIIITIYSAWGGIKAVSYTDVIQIIVFACILPVIILIISSAIEHKEQIQNTLTQNKNLNIFYVLDFKKTEFWSAINLLIIFALPGMGPEFFQRVLMAKHVKQIKETFSAAGKCVLLIIVGVSLIGFFIKVINPNLKPEFLLNHIIAHYAYEGFKGVFAAGIMAAIMSTADSGMNSAAVLIAHDILNYKIKQKHQLLIGRLSSVIIGVICFFVAFENKVVSLIYSTWAFYMPVVTVPLLFAIFGFRSTPFTALTTMISAFLFVLALKYSSFTFDPTIPGMLFSSCVLLGTHYIFQQKGGWVGIKDTRSLKQERQNTKFALKKLRNEIVYFNFVEFSRYMTPKSSWSFGFVAISTVLLFNASNYFNHENFIHVVPSLIRFISIASAYFIGLHFLFPESYKKSKTIAVLWVLINFYNLTFWSTTMLMINEWNIPNISIFILSVALLIYVFSFTIALLMFFIGACISIGFLDLFITHTPLTPLYINVLIGATLVLLLVLAIIIKKRSQDSSAGVKEENMRITYNRLDKEFLSQEKLDEEFLHNSCQEVRTCISQINSGGAMLEKQAKEQGEDISEFITLKNSLENEVKEMVEFANTANHSLNFKVIDMSALIKRCVFQYLSINKQQIIIDNESTLHDINCDYDKIYQVIDRLIKVAIKNKSNNIIVQVRDYDITRDGKTSPAIIVKVSNDGDKIKEDLIGKIFSPYITIFNDKEQGFDLTICKKIIDLHFGSIEAYNNYDKGFTISFILPLGHDLYDLV